MFTHFPKDPLCEICQACKITRAPCKSKCGHRTDSLPVPVNFGDAITADHKILNEEDQSREEDRVACVIQDRATSWLQAYPAPKKDTKETMKAFERFLGPQGKCKHVYTDNSKEFIASLEVLGYSHDTSTPHRPETNGVAESAVKRVREGTACALTQSGLHDKWWRYAMWYFCWCRNVKDI